MGRVTAEIKVADEVWIATALLHQERPEAADFSKEDIKARLLREGLTGRSFEQYFSVNAVANRKPSSGIYRVLFETAPSRRRLFRPGDPYDPLREGGQIKPRREDVPPRYHHLLDWYDREWATRAGNPVLALRRKYADLWRGGDADEYVRQLREGWE